MKCLNETEIAAAVSIITDLYFDAKVITAIRDLIKAQQIKENVWRREFERAFPPPEMDDTQPFTPVFDGD